MPSFKIIGLLVLEKNVLKVFAIYSHGGHLGHVTLTIYIVLFFHPKYTTYQKLASIGQVVTEKIKLCI